MMKKIILAVLMASAFGGAQANTLSIVNQSATFGFSGYNGQPKTVTGAESAGVFGTLSASGPGTFSVTYLGNESGYSNQFKFGLSLGSALLDESALLGKTISAEVGAGAIDFKFKDSQGNYFKNGSTPSSVLGYAFLLNNMQSSSFAASTTKGNFQYLLGFNDSYNGDADYDDFVVGVNYTPSAVPLPAAGWLFGSALLGFVTMSNRRRI